MPDPVPVVLFAYARPEHLARTLEALRRNRVPLLYAFADGARGEEDRPAVEQVRDCLRAVDWCEVVRCERTQNLGLGRSILTGVSDVLARHDAAIVIEDDVVTVPGAHAYLCAALRRYRDEPRVMSVSAWTHPRVTPADVDGRPFFSGRAEIWGWATWARAWTDMHRDALALARECRSRGIDVYRYGADLPVQAEREAEWNIWGVRWLHAHLLRGGLCLYPPRALAENIGFDPLATHTRDHGEWAGADLADRAPEIADWPEPVEHPEAAALCRRVYGGRPSAIARWLGRAQRSAGRAARRAGLRPRVGGTA